MVFEASGKINSNITEIFSCVGKELFQKFDNTDSYYDQFSYMDGSIRDFVKKPDYQNSRGGEIKGDESENEIDIPCIQIPNHDSIS